MAMKTNLGPKLDLVVYAVLATMLLPIAFLGVWSNIDGNESRRRVLELLGSQRSMTPILMVYGCMSGILSLIISMMARGLTRAQLDLTVRARAAIDAAVNIQIVHAVVIVALGALSALVAEPGVVGMLFLTGVFFLYGTLAFCSSEYVCASRYGGEYRYRSLKAASSFGLASLAGGWLLVIPLSVMLLRRAPHG